MPAIAGQQRFTVGYPEVFDLLLCQGLGAQVGRPRARLEKRAVRPRKLRRLHRANELC